MSDDKLIEAMARAVYALLKAPTVIRKPAWVDGGNSLKQDEARDYARAALAVVRQAEGWQPIETAPKDEYLLLSDGEDVYFGKYGWDEGVDERPVFFHDGPGIRGMSHWLRLPEPPA